MAAPYALQRDRDSPSAGRRGVSRLYRLAVGVVRLLSPLLSLGESKLAHGIAGRRRAHEILAAWGRVGREPDRPAVWFHAPSVGEGFQAEAVIEALRARRPDVQIVYTFFSPSAVDLARRMDVDVAAYLPWDLQRPVGEVLDAVRPEAVVFTKTEVWPTLTREASRRGIPVAIVGTSVPDGAKRSGPLARAFLRSTWQRLSLACANSDADAAGLQRLGVSPSRIEVTGDPGIDSALDRFERRDRQAPWVGLFTADERPCVVAGSTWPADERVLLPALGLLRRAVPHVRIVLAPHEPSASAVGALVDSLREDGWNPSTLAAAEATGLAGDAVVVERVGVLAALYGVATAAFVGGGYHDAGLHSVLEPAAAGCPVVFGPRHENARAAGDLLVSGGAKIASDPQTLAGVLIEWLTDLDARSRAGGAGIDYLAGHRGAADRCARLLNSQMSTDG